MVGPANPENTPLAKDVWNALRDFLNVDLDIQELDDSASPPQFRVTITATNTAPSGTDQPEVVFMGVQLRTGDKLDHDVLRTLKSTRTDVPNGRNRAGWSLSGDSPRPQPMLSSGESIMWELECPSSQLPEIQPKVDAYLAWDTFFAIPKELFIPTTYTQPKVLEYVRAFNDIKYWEALSPRLEDINLPSGETTFAEIQAFTQRLATSLAMIEEVRGRFSSLSTTIVGPEARAHRSAAGEYLIKQRELRQGLKDAVATAESDQIAESTSAFN
ncbi:MAG: hypothetical protein IIC27_06440, partial [Chloroflexi bacterium]|nr:hypothetical protein [Chloroflexota bacterium]